MKTSSLIFFFSFPSLTLFAKHHEILYLPGNDDTEKGKPLFWSPATKNTAQREYAHAGKDFIQKHGFECKVLFSWDNSGKYRSQQSGRVFVGGIILEMPTLLIGTRFFAHPLKILEHVTEFQCGKANYWHSHFYSRFH